MPSVYSKTTAQRCSSAEPHKKLSFVSPKADAETPEPVNSNSTVPVNLMLPISTHGATRNSDNEIRKFVANLLTSKPSDIRFFATVPIRSADAVPPGAILGVQSDSNIITTSYIQSILSRNRSLDASLQTTVQSILDMQQARGKETRQAYQMIEESQQAERAAQIKLNEQYEKVRRLEDSVRNLTAQLDQSEALRREGQHELGTLRDQFRSIISDVRSATSRQGVRSLQDNLDTFEDESG